MRGDIFIIHRGGTKMFLLIQELLKLMNKQSDITVKEQRLNELQLMGFTKDSKDLL